MAILPVISILELLNNKYALLISIFFSPITTSVSGIEITAIGFDTFKSLALKSPLKAFPSESITKEAFGIVTLVSDGKFLTSRLLTKTFKDGTMEDNLPVKDASKESVPELKRLSFNN